MKRFPDPNWVLILLFLALLASVPAVQTVIELRQEDGIGALEVFGSSPTAANLRGFEQNMEKASWVGRWSRPWMQFAHFNWFKDGGEKVVLGSPGWYFYKPGLNYMLARQAMTEPGSTTNDPVAAIVDFRDQLAAYGFRLLVMPVPNKDSIYPDRLTSRVEASRAILTPRTREVIERLQAAQVEVVDLFKEFAEARQRDPSNDMALYLSQDTHWSPAGVAAAAKAVARRLTDLGWIQPGRVDYRERAAPVQRIGDLVRMLQVPMIERELPPEKVSSVQVVQGAECHPYKDELDAQILVMGDSFMRIYQQDQPTSAGFIAHLAKELKQPMMSIVNDGGGGTLVREELCARPMFLKNKRVVLWEFVERDLGLAIKGWPRTRLPPP